MAGNAERGKFIVIDGNEGSGKATQLDYLRAHFEELGLPVETFDFPQYNTFHGKLIGRLQMGEFGNPGDFSPYIATYPYAEDRRAVAPEIQKALVQGKFVLANRYVTSNFAHQSSKLLKAERETFVNWNMELEYDLNGIPKEDLVIYLFVPHQTSKKLMENKERGERGYTKGKGKDLLEQNEKYLTESEIAYLELVDRFEHWVQIECVDEEGNMLPREEIHEKVKNLLKKRRIL